jgi:hypothetical protein
VARDGSKGGVDEREAAAFREQQEEMLRLLEEYGQARETVWTREIRSLENSWEGFQRDWRGSMDQMTALAGSRFQEISAQGQAMGAALAGDWEEMLASLTTAADEWAAHMLATLNQVGGAWQGMFGGGGGGGWLSWLGLGFDFGGIFHQGGVVEAHRGMAAAPETLLEDEQMVVVQSGEGILPRESMVRLGTENFEALRSGQFVKAAGQAAPRYDITIQVQSLDGASAAGLDWDRVVQRHLMPALQKELGRRW